MNDFAEKMSADPSLCFLKRDGEMRRRIREFDWGNTAMGNPSSWPSSLKTAVALMLDCAGPAYIAYGRHFIQMYNDAYIPILGELKHPQALGRTTPETWSEIWDIVGPMFESILTTGQAISMENKLLIMLRNGYLEECYFNFSFSPINDEFGQILGVFALPWETTSQFVSNRRANTVRMLVQGLSEAADLQGVHVAFKNAVQACPHDLPFGLWYDLREDHTGLDLAMSAGIMPGSALCPEFVDLRGAGFYKGLLNMDSPVVTGRPFDPDLLCWTRNELPDVYPHELIIQPLCYYNCPRPDNYIVLGVNPMQPNDAVQKDFLQTIRLHLENAVRRVSRFELEQRTLRHRFETIMAVLPCLVWLSDTSQKCTFVNQTWIDFTGCSLEQAIKNSWSTVLHPDDVGEVVRYHKAFEERVTVTLEYRLKHAIGGYRWMLDKAMPRYDINGEFLGYIGTGIDITERKMAEEKILSSKAELRTLYDRLETAREEERYALAREVHDQLGQILSAAKIDIKLLEEDVLDVNAPLSPIKITSELQSAVGNIERAIQVVKRLATELRPPELESQGLAAAIQWHAQDFERRTKIRCSVSLEPDMPTLNNVCTVGLFGIFQEAMTNILRHAKATQITISLACRGSQIQLRVRDNGVGIGKARACSTSSNGIKGMRERAAIVGGKLLLGQLNPCGTLVTVRVPLFENGTCPSLGQGSGSYQGGEI